MVIDNLEDFLQGIQTKKLYSEGLQLRFYSHQFGIEEAKAIAVALQSGYCPPRLYVYLHSNQFGAEGGKAIATALQSGHCPLGLQLDLGANQLGAEGGKAIATALQSGHCPSGLQLYLGANQLGAEGGKALATALQSGHCPSGLQLYLAKNQLGAEGAKAIAAALQSGHCPQGLRLYLLNNSFDDESEETLQKAWAWYYAYQQEAFLKCIALQQGHQQASSPLSRLPLDILKIIQRYVLPATPVSAKMLEISAKAFRNHYTSGLFSAKTTATDALDSALQTALSAKRITQKAEQVDQAIEKFLQLELGTLATGAFVKSPTVALLCQYHLIAGNKVMEDATCPEHFQLTHQPPKKQNL